MNTIAHTKLAASQRLSSSVLVAIFCATIFLSASLLFSVQPLIAKIVLPLLGGSSGVWNTAMVFFQALLLGGYIYAWAISKWLPLRFQIPIHAVVTALGFAFLPLAVSQNWAPAAGAMPTLSILFLFLMSVGMPFFALSANAPLLQQWFSKTDHKDAEDPYWLYAFSNVGSLLILCAYPFVIEPHLALKTQTHLWMYGYWGLAALILIAGFSATRRMASAPHMQSEETVPATPFRAREALIWIGLAFIPSSLMLGVTTFVTNSIAAVPFLWIVPLALYLLTFVIVFARTPIVSAKKLAKCNPYVAIAALWACTPFAPKVLAIPVLISAVFVISLYMHAALVERRPEAARLTQFYIFMSLGGVLGGVFNALLAPLMFTGITEFSLILLVAGLVLAKGQTFTLPRLSQLNLAILFGLLSVCLAAVLLKFGGSAILAVALIIGGAFLAIAKLEPRWSLRLLLTSAVALFLIQGPWSGTSYIFKDRSFYSTLKVKAVGEGDQEVHKFIHGDTVHNVQLRAPELQAVPLSYYAFGNSFDKAVIAARTDRQNLRSAVIGLGAGAMACQEQAGETWTYFEIDPVVVDMARNPEYFSYLSRCAPNADVRIGDARLTIQDLADQSQDLIMIDAFTSNVIPAHLVTREAISIYRSKLAPGGVMFFHTSNRLMDISSVVAVTAEAEGLSHRVIYMKDFVDHPHADHINPSLGMLGGDEARLQEITTDPAWGHIQPAARVEPWTDDYASVFQALMAEQFEEREIIAREGSNPN